MEIPNSYPIAVYSHVQSGEIQFLSKIPGVPKIFGYKPQEYLNVAKLEFSNYFLDKKNRQMERGSAQPS